MSKLTEKQVRALAAVAEPESTLAQNFWIEARSRTNGRPNWTALRKTLGSLQTRKLVSYDGTWHVTEAGRTALEEARA